MKVTADQKEYNRQKQAKYRAKQSQLAKRKRDLKQKYKISWEDYILMYDSQHGSCKICRKPLQLLSDNQADVANVDHCHTTKKIRGLLCNSCNRGIGYLQDSSSLLRIAAEYLDESHG